MVLNIRVSSVNIVLYFNQCWGMIYMKQMCDPEDVLNPSGLI